MRGAKRTRNLRTPARYSVSKKPTVIVWLLLASIANTSNLYSVPDSKNSAGTVKLVFVGATSAVKARKDLPAPRQLDSRRFQSRRTRNRVPLDDGIVWVH